MTGPSTSTRVRRQVLLAQQSRPHRIVDVVIDVGDDVGDARDLPFDRAGAMLGIGAPTGMPLLPFECRAMPSRTSHVRFRPCAIVLEHVDDAQALLVVIEAAGNQIVR